MTGRASALAVLGLQPGADAAAIEKAYRQLIKQHHPDRQGGDASRAAEINRAYRELRDGKSTADPLQFNDQLDVGRRRRRWPVAALFATASMAVLILLRGPSTPLTQGNWQVRAQMALGRHSMPTRTLVEPMAEKLHLDAINEAVRDAQRTFRNGNEMALANESRDCQRRFRERPGTLLLDRCAAFDDAVIGLENRDPLGDEGPFAPLAVTGRQWGAGSALSDDDLAIDDRLDEIRLRVELALAPVIAPPAPAATPAVKDDGDD
jgi:hypothetical protein